MGWTRGWLCVLLVSALCTDSMNGLSVTLESPAQTIPQDAGASAWVSQYTYIDWTTTIWILNETVVVKPPAVSAVTLANGSTCSPSWSLSTTPPGFFVDSGTGEIFSKPRVAQDVTSSCLLATCYGESACVANLSISIMASTVASNSGGGSMSSTSESITVTIVAVACTLGLLIMIVVGVFVRRLRNKQRAHDFVQQLDDMQREGFVEDYFHEDFLIQHNLVPQELNRKSLQKLEVVGSGQFGEVWKAVLYPHRSHKHLKDTEPLRVAAKVVNEDFQHPKGSHVARSELLAEAAIVAQLSGHEHVCGIIGVISIGNPLIVVLDFCHHGSLKGYLERRAKHNDIANARLKCSMCVEIAMGMAHIADRRFIHRDLAARNVLVADREGGAGVCCKIADFGLTRGSENRGNRLPPSVVSGTSSSSSNDYATYMYRGGSGSIAIRWAAPECLHDRMFSMASDVWAYGVLALEIYDDGRVPYHSMTNHEVIRYVVGGYKPRRPEQCPRDVFAIMRSCWRMEPTARPSFLDLIEQLTAVADTQPGVFRLLSKVNDWNPSPTSHSSGFSGAMSDAESELDSIFPGSYRSCETVKFGSVVEEDVSSVASNASTSPCIPKSTGSKVHVDKEDEEGHGSPMALWANSRKSPSHPIAPAPYEYGPLNFPPQGPQPVYVLAENVPQTAPLYEYGSVSSVENCASTASCLVAEPYPKTPDGTRVPGTALKPTIVATDQDKHESLRPPPTLTAWSGGDCEEGAPESQQEGSANLGPETPNQDTGGKERSSAPASEPSRSRAAKLFKPSPNKIAPVTQ